MGVRRNCKWTNREIHPQFSLDCMFYLVDVIQRALSLTNTCEFRDAQDMKLCLRLVFSRVISWDQDIHLFFPPKVSPDGNWGYVSISRMLIYVVLLSSKAVAVIPQQDQVRQLKHYIISVELLWKDEPEEKETGTRMVRRKKLTCWTAKKYILTPTQVPLRHYLIESSQESCKLGIKNQLSRWRN